MNCVKLPSVLLQLSSGPQNCSPHFTPWSAVTVRNFLVRSLPLRRSASPQSAFYPRPRPVHLGPQVFCV